MHKQLAESNIDTFLVRGRKPSAGEAERSGKRGFGGGSPRLRQKKSAVSHASEASVYGSEPFAGEAEHSDKRDFRSGSPRLRQKKPAVSQSRGERPRQISGAPGAAAPDYDKISSA